MKKFAIAVLKGSNWDDKHENDRNEKARGLIPQAPLALISNYEKRGCRATALWRAKIISAADSAVTLMMKLPPLQPRHLEAVTFSAKAAVSALAGVVGYQFLQLPGAPWLATVSAVVVTQPALHSSLKASLLRVAANLAGAFGGAALSLVIGQPLVAMTIGIMLTGLVCYALKQDRSEARRVGFSC